MDRFLIDDTTLHAFLATSDEDGVYFDVGETQEEITANISNSMDWCDICGCYTFCRHKFVPVWNGPEE